MVHQSSCVNTPQQNGVFERKNCHLLEVTRSLLFGSNVPKHFWFDALLTTCFLINRMPSKVLKFQTPLSTLQTFFPTSRTFSDIDLRVFGCSAFVHIHESNRGKLDARSCKCVFLGYSSVHKGYRCYSPEKRKYFLSKDVAFIENQLFFPKNTTQGEILCDDSNFWDKSKQNSGWDKSEQNSGWDKSSICRDKSEQDAGWDKSSVFWDKSKQNSGLDKSEQNSVLISDWEYFWNQNPYLVDTNPKIYSHQILNKSVSIIPYPNNLHENNSHLVDMNPKISSNQILNKSIPIILDSTNPDSISNSNIEKSGPTTPPNLGQPSQPAKTSPFAFTYSGRKTMHKTSDMERS